jgi:hypothetical protein
MEEPVGFSAIRILPPLRSCPLIPAIPIVNWCRVPFYGQNCWVLTKEKCDNGVGFRWKIARLSDEIKVKNRLTIKQRTTDVPITNSPLRMA